MLKIGLVGCGNIANSHVDAYSRIMNRIEIIAVCDINEKRAISMAERLGIPSNMIFTDVHEMVKVKEIDAVDVCVWNNAHCECSVAALEAGKHCFCEKPMAMNAKEAQKMIDARDKSGKHLQIGFVRRFGNDCDIMKQLNDENYFGELYFAKVCYLRRHGAPGGWFVDKSRSGGGPLIDLGVHVIDFAHYVMGLHKPVSVYGFTFDKLKGRDGTKRNGGWRAADATDHDDYTVEDFAGGIIRLDNGAIISLETSFSANTLGTGEMEFLGTKAGAKLTPELRILNETSGFMTNVTFDYPTTFNFGDAFAKQMNHFCDCVELGTPCKSSAEDGLVIMKILDAIYESAKTGHEVVIG